MRPSRAEMDAQRPLCQVPRGAGCEPPTKEAGCRCAANPRRGVLKRSVNGVHRVERSPSLSSLVKVGSFLNLLPADALAQPGRAEVDHCLLPHGGRPGDVGAGLVRLVRSLAHEQIDHAVVPVDCGERQSGAACDCNPVQIGACRIGGMEGAWRGEGCWRWVRKGEEVSTRTRGGQGVGY